MEVPRIPAYPSAQARKNLSPSRLATLNQNIARALAHILSLPDQKLSTQPVHPFLVSYLKHAAYQHLQSLIWDHTVPPQQPSNVEKLISRHTLSLAKRVGPSLDVRTLLDLAIVYAPKHVSTVRSIFSSTKTDWNAESLVEGFKQVLTPSQGLYALRKSSHILACLLSVAPPPVLLAFAHSKPFLLSLATTYDEGLGSIARSYGGLPASIFHQPGDSVIDDWIPIYLQTKVALLDSLHSLFSALLSSLASSSGRSLAEESEYTFGLMFSLLEISPPRNSSHTQPPTPFLNLPLLTDYHHAYNLSHTLTRSLSSAAEKDARLDILESSLGSTERGDPGGLKFLLRGSGRPQKPAAAKAKAKEETLPLAPQSPVPPSSSGDEIDIQIIQILDILPDQDPSYLRALLVHPVHGGSVEHVVEGLLGGSAPPLEQLEAETLKDGGKERERATEVDQWEFVNNRLNIFDGDEMDLGRVKFGKDQSGESSTAEDKALMEQIKASILRRAEEMVYEDATSEEEMEETGKARAKVLAYEDEDTAGDGVKVLGGGSSESGEEDDSGDEAAEKPSVETTLELAYIRDPALFHRDAATRKSVGRAELRRVTGWLDDQIEGWKIMLERNPKKDKILAKHEFSGNQPAVPNEQPLASSSSRARGRGGRGGRGRGRGRGGGDGGEEGGNARERAWKDKNKASRGNHNRKRGHDKKMARAGGPS